MSLEAILDPEATQNKQKKAIHSLESDIKAQQAQIGMLEELFRELNAGDRVTEMKKQRAMEAAKAKTEEIFTQYIKAN